MARDSEQHSNGLSLGWELFPQLQAFSLLGISRHTGYRLIKSGKLGPIKKIGRRSYIASADLEKFIASL